MGAQSDVGCSACAEAEVGSYKTMACYGHDNSQFSPCTNKPAHSHYTGAGSDFNDDCSWECDTDYDLIEGGTTCSKVSAKLSLVFKDKEAYVQVYDSGALHLNARCVEPFATCGSDNRRRLEEKHDELSSTVAAMAERLDVLEQGFAALKSSL